MPTNTTPGRPEPDEALNMTFDELAADPVRLDLVVRQVAEQTGVGYLDALDRLQRGFSDILGDYIVTERTLSDALTGMSLSPAAVEDAIARTLADRDDARDRFMLDMGGDPAKGRDIDPDTGHVLLSSHADAAALLTDPARLEEAWLDLCALQRESGEEIYGADGRDEFMRHVREYAEAGVDWVASLQRDARQAVVERRLAEEQDRADAEFERRVRDEAKRRQLVAEAEQAIQAAARAAGTVKRLDSREL